MIHIKTVFIPLYKQIVKFLIGDPYEVQEYLRDVYRGDFSFNPNTSDAVVLHRDLVSYIWFDMSKVTVPIIAHELDHAVFDLMLDLGLELTDQEAFCYLDEFLMEQCADIFAIQMVPINLQKETQDKEDEQALSSTVKETL